jgi:hypothetical protein
MKIQIIIVNILVLSLISCNKKQASNGSRFDINLNTSSNLHQKILIDGKAVLIITNPTMKSGNLINYEFSISNNDLSGMSLMVDTKGKLIGINYNSKINDQVISQTVKINSNGRLVIE